ncbi:MAG TPA: pyridoxal 5'-phosphate synthase glutaminase subunit PdxT [Acidimicrobiales bacterium]|nr:pyridoxal 5'-phosphate synthase glutaminase subunit PdxT [Acidimicrobiales bacterium]
MPKVGVLALQGDVREHAAALADAGATPVEVRVPEDLGGVDSLVLPGGESTTLNLLLKSSGLWSAIDERLRDGMPAFGTCAGMILLARHISDGRPDQTSFAAIDIAVRRNGYGRQLDSFETDLPVEGLSTPMHAVFIRAPLVERTGPDVEVLARHDGVPVVCKQNQVVVAAFHPELSADGRLHELFLDTAGRGVGAPCSGGRRVGVPARENEGEV